MSMQSSTPTPSRRITRRGTSNALSRSVNPDEDWTKLSDSTQRRRLQNRIAQRNYRQKLKRHVENLEKMTGSSSSPQTNAKTQHQDRESVQQSSETIHRQASLRLLQNQYPPPTGDNMIFGHPFQREASLTGPLFTCHTYSPQQPYYPVSTTGDQFGYYLVPVPVTLPPTIHYHEAKQDGHTLSPFNTGYPEIDHASHGYEDEYVSTVSTISTIANSPLRTPPRSHSYEHSTTCSESGYHYPTTLSRT